MGVSYTGPTRVFLIEAQPLMARALAATIARDPLLQLAGYSSSLQPRRLIEASPDLVLIDLDSPDGRATAQIAECRRLLSRARLCALSSAPSIDVMMQVLWAGANGYIIKDVTPRRFLACVHGVTQNSFYADPRMSTKMMRRTSERVDSHLSPRETQVVQLIAQGLSNKQISDHLILSDKTVKNHVANIFSKLNVTARTQVAIFAIRAGIG